MRATFAVIRYIPSIFREEFINVGVILVCPDTRYQAIKALPSFDKDRSKLAAFEDTDGRFVQHAITKLKNAADDKRFDELVGNEAAPEGMLSSSGIRTLARTYHNNLRISEPRTALTTDPAALLNELYGAYVSQEEPTKKDAKVTRSKMRSEVKKVFRRYELFARYPDRVREKVRPPVPLATQVDFAYRNGVMHYYHAVPFDNVETAAGHANDIRAMANDLRNPDLGLDSVFRNAKFTIFGYFPTVNGGEDVREARALLEQEDITVLDYMVDAEVVAKQIRRELDDNNGGGPVL